MCLRFTSTHTVLFKNHPNFDFNTIWLYFEGVQHFYIAFLHNRYFSIGLDGNRQKGEVTLGNGKKMHM